MKRPPKSSFLEKQLHFDLLNCKVTLCGLFLAIRIGGSRHVSLSFDGFQQERLKNVQICHKLGQSQPLGGVGGSDIFFFLRMEIRPVKIRLSCDKTFVVRRTRDHSKPKLTKICPKSVKNRQNALLGVRPKKFFVQNVSTHRQENFLGQKFFSEIKNKKI